MIINEEIINCRQYPDYKYSKRIAPFTLAHITFCYETDISDKRLLDRIFLKGEELAQKVNPAAANLSRFPRKRDRLINNASAGLLSEYCWKKYINHKSGKETVDYTEFTEASSQIDLIVIGNQKLIEVRSSFPRNGIVFSICHQKYEFDILGPYTNSVKPGEIQKDFYTRTLYHIPAGKSFLDLAKKDGFKSYLTGGATWEMMTDNEISFSKDLLPDDAVSIAEEDRSSYRVVPFSKAIDSPGIIDLIMK